MWQEGPGRRASPYRLLNLDGFFMTLAVEALSQSMASDVLVCEATTGTGMLLCFMLYKKWAYPVHQGPLRTDHSATCHLLTRHFTLVTCTCLYPPVFNFACTRTAM